MGPLRFLPLAFALLWAAEVAKAKENSTSQQPRVCSTPEEDKVLSLPGWDQPLPSAWYSGYLDYEFEGQQIHTHYLLVEAEGEGAAQEKPLIYWSNGGPGASSFYGLLTELGPLQLSDDSLVTESARKTGIPTPIYVKTNWARFGSILIIDQPAPIGFSYCNDDDTANPESHSCGGIAWTDELTSANAYMALQTFYQKFPCYSTNKDLYLTGESYGGIYIPTLARRIYYDQSDDDSPKALLKKNLKGFSVGDGCLGTKTPICGNIDRPDQVDFFNALFLAGHHQIPVKSFRELIKACKHKFEEENDRETNVDESGNVIFDTQGPEDSTCQEVVKKITKEVGGVFDYSLYDECTYRNGLSSIKSAVNDYACGGGLVMEEYLKRDDVMKALHVRSAFFSVDNAEGDFDYTPTEPNISGFYKEINGKLRVIVYNGDIDPAITSFATEFWTSRLGLTTVEEWRPWTVDSCRRMGGYVTRYEGGLDVLTIRGAGHMVPTYKPDASFAFMKAWFEGETYPLYDPGCTGPETVLGKVESKAKATMLRSAK